MGIPIYEDPKVLDKHHNIANRKAKRGGNTVPVQTHHGVLVLVLAGVKPSHMGPTFRKQKLLR